MDASTTQWHVHNGHAGPVLVQYMLANQQQLELWVNSQSISEGGLIVSEVFNDHEYLKHGVTLQPGDTVIDIGANIGVFGARVLSMVPGGDVRYVGIEPCPQNFKLLQRNLLGTDGAGQLNSVFHINQQLSAPLQEAAAGVRRHCAAYPGNVQLLQAGVSSRCGTASITYYPHMPGNSTLRPGEKQLLQGAITPPKFLEGAESIEVSMTTLPELLHKLSIAGPIGLLKIDVEGEELEVLRGINDVCWDRIQQVALEVHDCIDLLDDLTPTQEPATPTVASTSMLQQPEVAAAAGGAGMAAHGQQQLTQQLVQALQDNPALASTADTFLSLHQALLASLPGPRTCRDIDGQAIRYHPLPLKMLGAPLASAAGPAAHHVLPPPRDEGRVMAVAKMLRDKGFRVVMECPLGLLMNYTVYGVKQGAR